MSREPNPTTPMCVYRFPGSLPLHAYLTRPEGADIEYDGPIEIAEVTGHLLAGTHVDVAPSWKGSVVRIGNRDLNLFTTTAFAVILVPIDKWVIAVTFGGGRHLLDSLRLDESFGLLFGIRRLDPAKLRKVSRNLLDITARMTETSFPSGSTLTGFRIERAGELVTRLTGKADLSGLTYYDATGGRQYQIRAGSSLHLPLGNSPNAFLSDIEEICRIVEQSDENSPLRFVSQVRPICDNDPLLPNLDGRLAVALGGDDQFGPLGLCWPTAAAAVIDEANSFRTNNIGGLGPVELDANLDITTVTERFADISLAARVSELRDSRLIPCADDRGDEPLTRPIPMDRWIAFETTVGTNTYCLHQGRWYEIGEEAVAQVRAQVAELVSNTSALSFPQWVPTGKQDDEHRYCKKVARQPGYLCLDRSLAHTPMHTKFELADIIGPANEIVHIKWLSRATAASHLITQARVSAWAQRLEPEAMEQLDAKVHLLDNRRRVLDRPRVVVLAAAGRRWHVDELFTLSMVDLLRLNEDMHANGITLQFANIPYVPKPKRRGKTAGPSGGKAA